jgi:hypothetical protein
MDFTQQLVLRQKEIEEENRDLTLQLSEYGKKDRAFEAQRVATEKALEREKQAVALLHKANDEKAAANRKASRANSRARNAEAEIEELKAKIVAFHEQPSRLAQLREEIEA